MLKSEEIQVGMLVKVKSGKLYKIEGRYQDKNEVRWAQTPVLNEAGEPVTEEATSYDGTKWQRGVYQEDRTRVEATQWQVNEKYPEGRYYQASRTLKLKDLSPV